MTTAGTSPPTAKPGSLDEQLLSRAFLQDPYPTHRRLRREDPVHWCEPWRMWMVSRYEDVRTVLLKDGTTFSAVGQTSAALSHLSSVEHSQLESLQRIFSAGLLWSDPPDHTRIRSAVNKALKKRMIKTPLYLEAPSATARLRHRVVSEQTATIPE